MNNIESKSTIDTFEIINDKNNNKLKHDDDNNFTEYDMMSNCCEFYKTMFNTCANVCVKYFDIFNEYCKIKKITKFARFSHKSID